MDYLFPLLFVLDLILLHASLNRIPCVNTLVFSDSDSDVNRQLTSG